MMIAVCWALLYTPTTVGWAMTMFPELGCSLQMRHLLVLTRIRLWIAERLSSPDAAPYGSSALIAQPGFLDATVPPVFLAASK